MGRVNTPPADLDATRAAIGAGDLTTDASAFITYEVAVHLPFESLGRFKTLLKQFFSAEPWTTDDADTLSALVTPHVGDGWWEHNLDGGIEIAHGIRNGRYHLWVTGAAIRLPSLFDRVFDGPVVPEPTPHPRKVKFVTGGEPEPGVWYRRTDGNPADPRVTRLLEESDVTDVMVAGNFVTVGLERTAAWQERLDPILILVTNLFAGGEPVVDSSRTREQLMQEAGHVHLDVRPSELHLLDPDDPNERARLTEALDADDARLRRVAVAILADSRDDDIRRNAVRLGAADEARIVRRAAIDAAADFDDESLRDLFEAALQSEDAWVRWKAVRTLGELGVGESRDAIHRLVEDEDFQVRFEVARALRL
jgi:hypothetical protein